MEFVNTDLEKIEEAESKIGRRENIVLEKGKIGRASCRERV